MDPGAARVRPGTRRRVLRLVLWAALVPLACGTAVAQDDSLGSDFGYGAPDDDNATSNASVATGGPGLLSDFSGSRWLVPVAGMAGRYVVDGEPLPSLSALLAGVGVALLGIGATFASDAAAARRFMDDWNRVYTTLTHALVLVGMLALAATLGALGGIVAAAAAFATLRAHAHGRFLAWLKDLDPTAQ